jgi:hypothetical protein
MPTDKELTDLSKKDVKTKGRVWHLLKCVEECSELSKAIMQHITKGDPVTPILQEVGDMEMALRNLRTIYGDKIIDKLKAEKYEKRDDKLEDKKPETTDVIKNMEEINKGR